MEVGIIFVLFEGWNNLGGNLQDTEQSIYVTTVEKSTNTENRHSVMFEKVIFLQYVFYRVSKNED